MTHGRVVCRKCNRVIMSCRCMEAARHTSYSVCFECTRGSPTFTCSACGGTFEKGWSEAEALAEMRAKFGNLPEHQLEVVCGECVTKLDSMIERSTN